VAERSRREFIADSVRWGAGAVLCSRIEPAVSAVLTTRPRNTIPSIGVERLQRFIGSVTGRTITPRDRDYNSAREVWNHAFDKLPGLIVRCANSEDVVRTIEFAGENDVLLAVRSGAHSLAGKSTCDGGLVLDLSDLKTIHVDVTQQTATVGAGLLIGEFDEATQAQGLVTNTGTESSVGLAGLTLGGGLGWLMGKYGLACDNLRSASMVLANGQTATVDKTQNPDIFWALRGAGANFGVVTELQYDLHPLGPILGGGIQFPLDSMRGALKHYREFVNDIPDELGMTIGLVPGQDGKLILSLAVCYCGDIQKGEKLLEPLRKFRPILQDGIQPMSYVAYQTLASLPPGLKLSCFVRSSFLNTLSDGAIDVITAYAESAPPLIGACVIECLHGAASRVPADATAFPHRFKGLNFSFHADWITPAGRARAEEWGSSFWNSMQPYLRPAVYSNYLDDEDSSRVRAAYGSNYQRLANLKSKYDPANLFQLNQNILPATG
jgi:hypothetical protein